MCLVSSDSVGCIVPTSLSLSLRPIPFNSTFRCVSSRPIPSICHRLRSPGVRRSTRCPRGSSAFPVATGTEAWVSSAIMPKGSPASPDVPRGEGGGAAAEIALSLGWLSDNFSIVRLIYLITPTTKFRGSATGLCLGDLLEEGGCAFFFLFLFVCFSFYFLSFFFLLFFFIFSLFHSLSLLWMGYFHAWFWQRIKVYNFCGGFFFIAYICGSAFLNLWIRLFWVYLFLSVTLFNKHFYQSI